MSEVDLEKSWAGVSASQRQEIEIMLAEIAARFPSVPNQSRNDCLDRCSDMHEAMQAACDALTDDMAMQACAINAEHAMDGCYKSCGNA
jgi:hypothetical protein